jgi:hypothetical protein
MNAETAGQKAYKHILEDVIGLRLNVDYTTKGSAFYLLYDGDYKFIKKFYNLNSILNFICINFKIEFSFLEEMIITEKRRIFKENEDALISAESIFFNQIKKPNNKKKDPDILTATIQKGKKKSTKILSCPFCKYKKLKIRKRGSLYIEYRCLNCFRHHFRDFMGDMMPATRSTANLNAMRRIPNDADGT